MKTLIEMAEWCAKQVLKTDAETIAYAKQCLAQRYQMLWARELWRDSQVMLAMSVNSEEVVLPSYVERVIALRAGGSRFLKPTEAVFLMEANPDVFEQEGTVTHYSELSSIGTHSIRPNVRLRVVSTHANDAGKEVLLRGFFNGLEVAETLELGGTTAVVSLNSYDLVTTFAKPLTLGGVTLSTDEVDTVVMQTLASGERSRLHPRLWLHEKPSEEIALLILAKKRCEALSHDLDRPTLRGAETVLEMLTVVDLLRRERQYAKARELLTDAGAEFANLLAQENQQSARVQRVMPEPLGMENPLAWLN